MKQHHFEGPIQMTAISIRPALALAAAVSIAALLPHGASAQSAEGTLSIAVADWLEPWDASTGGWLAVPAGTTPSAKATVRSAMSAELSPGTYDVYWLQSQVVDPLPIAAGVTVAAGEETTVRAVTGIHLEAADWVPLRDPDTGWLGAILPTDTSFDRFINITGAGSTLYLPPGEYDIFYEADETDDIPAIWLATATVELPFGGLGIEVAVEDGDVTVIRTLPGGPADSAGLQAGDIILTVDGTALTGMQLTEAVDLLRGPSESEAILTIARGKGADVELIVTRSRVEPDVTIRANSGVELTWSGPNPIGESGVWGVVYADEPLSGGYVNFSAGGAGGPLLLGPAFYDVYWNPDGNGPDELLAEDVPVSGGIVQVPVAPAK